MLCAGVTRVFAGANIRIKERFMLDYMMSYDAVGALDPRPLP